MDRSGRKVHTGAHTQMITQKGLRIDTYTYCTYTPPHTNVSHRSEALAEMIYIKHTRNHTHTHTNTSILLISIASLLHKRTTVCMSEKKKETDREDGKTRDSEKNGGKRGMKHEKQRQTGMN